MARYGDNTYGSETRRGGEQREFREWESRQPKTQYGWGRDQSGARQSDREGYGRDFGQDDREQSFGSSGRSDYDQDSGGSSGFGEGGAARHGYRQQGGYGRQGNDQQAYGQQGGSGAYRSSEQGGDYGQYRQGYAQGGYAERGGGWGGTQSSGWGSSGGGMSDRGAERGRERGFLERAGDEVSSWFGDDEARRRREADHRGKGPRGYTRSDDRIREDVSDRLSDDRMIDASEIDVTVENAEITLSGEVDSRQAKRRAEDCAEQVAGVKHVQNNLRVKSSGPGLGGSMGEQGRSAAGQGSSSGQSSLSGGRTVAPSSKSDSTV
jgi:osmotically-inducible protein OsmY